MNTLKALVAGAFVGLALGLAVPPEHPEPIPANNDYYLRQFEEACKGQLESDLSCSHPHEPGWDVVWCKDNPDKCERAIRGWE